MSGVGFKGPGYLVPYLFTLLLYTFPGAPSLQAPHGVGGGDCPVRPAGLPAAGVPAVLPVEGEEAGQEVGRAGEDRGECWQGGRGGRLQTGGGQSDTRVTLCNKSRRKCGLLLRRKRIRNEERGG